MMDGKNAKRALVKAINATAQITVTLRSKPSFASRAAEAAMLAEHLFDVAHYAGIEIAPNDVTPVAASIFMGAKIDTSNKYPWAELETEGRFFWPASNLGEAQKARASIMANGWKRYGAGRVKTRCRHDGVTVTMRKPTHSGDVVAVMEG